MDARTQRRLQRAQKKEEVEKALEMKVFDQFLAIVQQISTRLLTLPNDKVSLAIEAFHQFHYERRGKLLAVEQATQLLLQMHPVPSTQAYQWRNLVSAACALPWDLPVQLAQSGICYHGNLGEKPSSDEHAASILSSNETILRRSYK